MIKWYGWVREEGGRNSVAGKCKSGALGEATHGNKEFQELKLDVFAFVETTRVRDLLWKQIFPMCGGE